MLMSSWVDGVRINLRSITKCKRKVLEGHKSTPFKELGSAEGLNFREKANFYLRARWQLGGEECRGSIQSAVLWAWSKH